MTKIIIIADFQGPGSKPRRVFCSRLVNYLAEKGITFHILDMTPIKERLPFPRSSNHTYIGSKFFPTRKMPLFDQNKNRFLWDNSNFIDILKIFIGISIAAKNFYNITSKEKTKLIIQFNSTTTANRVISNLAKIQHIPLLHAQPGILPFTISFDTQGVSALSWPVNQHLSFKQLPINEEDKEITIKYLRFLKSKMQINNQQVSEEIEDIKAKYSNHNKRVILLVGSGEYGNGIWPRWYPESFSYSPFFKNDLEVMPLLLKLAVKNNWLIIYKPHPLNPKRKIKRHSNLIIIKNDNKEAIHSCISIADVVVTLVSSASGLALMHDKPVVLLGRNGLSNMGTLYELKKKNEMEDLIKTALNKGISNEMLKNWHDYCSRTIKYYDFAETEESEKYIGRSIEEAGEFILKTIHNNN